MTIRYSPAPWHYRISENCPDVWEIIAPFCESPIAEVPRWKDEDGNDSEEAESNAALMTAAPRMYETLSYVAEMLSGFKPDFLRNMGLDVALEETLAVLRMAVADIGRRS